MEANKLKNSSEIIDLAAYRENWVTRDGRTVTLRSITSEDKRIEKELIEGLSLQSSVYRFFHPIKEASPEMVDKFCDIDYKNEVAVIAEYSINGRHQNVGVVRLYIDPGRQSGEFAILVADGFQDSGLGTKFMETLITIARQKGLKRIYGVVLADNVKMRNLVKEFGFKIGPGSYGEVEVSLEI